MQSCMAPWPQVAPHAAPHRIRRAENYRMLMKFYPTCQLQLAMKTDIHVGNECDKLH